MGQKEGACLICGEPIVYYETSREMNCEICGKSFCFQCQLHAKGILSVTNATVNKELRL